jgi:hypothetical protein
MQGESRSDTDDEVDLWQSTIHGMNEAREFFPLNSLTLGWITRIFNTRSALAWINPQDQRNGYIHPNLLQTVPAHSLLLHFRAGQGCSRGLLNAALDRSDRIGDAALWPRTEPVDIRNCHGCQSLSENT